MMEYVVCIVVFLLGTVFGFCYAVYGLCLLAKQYCKEGKHEKHS